MGSEFTPRGLIGPKSKALIELTLWVGIAVWMLFYFALGVVMAWVAYIKLPWLSWVGLPWSPILRWATPVFFVLTVILTIAFMGRFVIKHLGRR